MSTALSTVVPIFTEDVDMGRKRLQQKGDLYEQGGWWKLRWREDQRKADGSIGYGWSRPVIIGPAKGAGRMTQKEARREAWDNFLSRLDQNMRTPQSIMTVAEFVERRFIPEHVAMLKVAGRIHYESILPHVLEGIPERRRTFQGRKMKDGKWLEDKNEQAIPRHFGIGKMRLRDVTQEQAQQLVSEAIRRGYSVQTAKHIKNVISGIFTHAEEKGWLSGRNPAYFVNLPEMERRPARALSFEELKTLLQSLELVPRTMVLCASLTSMNIAEVCGLRWKRVNLSADPITVDGESIPGFTAAVREQWHRREWGSVKAKARRRNLPLPSILVEALATVKAAAKPKSPEEPVFIGADGQQPLDQGAMLKGHVRKAASAFGAPKLGWHDLRRTFATMADQIGLTIGERQALMGHSSAEMTLLYTRTASPQAVAALELLAEKVKGTVQ